MSRLGIDSMMFPILDHLVLEDYQNVYEPSDDTFLLCDALEKDMQEGAHPSLHSLFTHSLTHSQGVLTNDMLIACEVGCGSGCVITHLARLFQERNHPIHCIGIDINPKALEVTNRTGIRNGILVTHSLTYSLTHSLTHSPGVHINTVRGNLLDSIHHTIDILLFNPPYVPTPDEEVQGCGIEASWAGGTDGRIVIDKFMPYVKDALSPGGTHSLTNSCTYLLTHSYKGRCYMVLVSENKPKEITKYFTNQNLTVDIVLRRQAVNEGLLIMRITKPIGH